ncbi:MAG TPA: hypothetical protein PKH94_04515, partial [Bacteroidales bacterium]|nr:hypothetical protein [Bacteroidales bacterium]
HSPLSSLLSPLSSLLSPLSSQNTAAMTILNPAISRLRKELQRVQTSQWFLTFTWTFKPSNDEKSITYFPGRAAAFL